MPGKRTSTTRPIGVVCLLKAVTEYPLVSLICKAGALNRRCIWYTFAFLSYYQYYTFEYVDLEISVSF